MKGLTVRWSLAEAPGSTIIGTAPILIEECEIVAIAEGREGFQSAARY